MAIEPISSAMTFNAQPVAQQQVAPRPVEKSADEFTEGSMQNATAPVDNVTLSVNAAQAKDGESGNQQNGQQEQQPYPFFHFSISRLPFPNIACRTGK